MSDAPTLEELRKVALADAARTDELVARARDGVPPEGDEEAFVREAAGRADDAALFARLGVADDTPAHESAPAPSHATPEPLHATLEPSHVSPAHATPEPSREAEVRPPRGRVLPFVAGGAVSAVALAAALVLVFRTPSVSLPPYAADVSGTDALVRSSPGATTEVSPGAHVVLVARPEAAVTVPVYARAFGGCGKESPLAVRVTVAPTGAARVEGSPEALFGAGAKGACTLAIALGTDTVPDAPDAAPGVVVVRARLDVK